MISTAAFILLGIAWLIALLAALLFSIQAVRYRKLRGLMTRNLPETWKRVEEIAAVGCWIGPNEFDQLVDQIDLREVWKTGDHNRYQGPL